jgi:hypothetical protein
LPTIQIARDSLAWVDVWILQDREASSPSAAYDGSTISVAASFTARGRPRIVPTIERRDPLLGKRFSYQVGTIAMSAESAVARIEVFTLGDGAGRRRNAEPIRARRGREDSDRPLTL